MPKIKHQKIVVVLMSVGSPRDSGEITEYVDSIRKEHRITKTLLFGMLKDPRNLALVAKAMRRPTASQVSALAEKYAQIGGSPLLSITRRQAGRLHSTLSKRGVYAKVVVAMKRLHPSIKEALAEARASDSTPVVGIVMFPSYSKVYSQEYEEMLLSGIKDLGIHTASVVVKSLDGNGMFRRALEESISNAYAPLRGRKTMVVFATHSVPKVLLDGGDPYIKNFESLAGYLARRLKMSDWTCAYYTGGHPSTVQEVTRCISKCKSEGYRRVLLVPLGYVADNFETLYGLGAMCKKAARTAGIGITIMRPLNDSTRLSNALSDIVIKAVQKL